MGPHPPAPRGDARSAPASRAYVALVYLIFLFSGAAALVYQVVWTRSLALVFGGSHLAVTTVLAVFMGGLALGGYLIGVRAARTERLLRLYGWLELGIAASAVLFALLVRVYPAIYVPLARLDETSPLYLSVLRVLFAIAVLLVPTTLMGGTLPVLSAFVGARTRELGRRLSFLYGFNTLGAVLGAGFAGFVLLRTTSIGTSLAVAVGINVVLGVLCLLLNDRAQTALASSGEDAPPAPTASPGVPAAPPRAPAAGEQLVLWGIGVSGFCALGYEVLWTRVLSIVIGASVYGFTVMLMAFLSGIALGSSAYGAWRRSSADGTDGAGVRRSVLAFGSVQILIGVTALVVTGMLRDLPLHALWLQHSLLGGGTAAFGTRQGVDFLLAFSYMFVPAFFMGVAFPLAGRIRAEHTGTSGRAVGETLAYNTVGAILGSAISGFVLIHAFGMERSLQLLSLVNVGMGLVVLASQHRRVALTRAVAAAVVVAAVLLASAGDRARMWDARFFAVFQTNRPDKFGSREKIQDTLRNTDVLYVAEGVSAIVSSIRVKGGTQSFVTNGRIEATDNAADLACQYTLGHLPMLLHPEPRKVFVLGTGSGMTLGATSVHPSVEEVVLAEIEPKVLGVARTFGRYNHDVLDDPKLRIVFNDGRNFLLTTRERFDVITADPIHPWFSGAGYLYTKEYFDLAADRLTPGGVMCQWLPIYELDGDDLKSIVRTFASSFAHVMVWLTHYDAHLVGSDEPFVIDRDVLERRIARPEILSDLQRVEMGSADDFLAFFLMGDDGAAAYARGGTLNTDDNLYLEFSAPFSIEDLSLVAANFEGLVSHRESLLPRLAPARTEEGRTEQARWCEAQLAAAAAIDPIRSQELAGRLATGDYAGVIDRFGAAYEGYAPWRFLRREFERKLAQVPRIVWQTSLAARSASGDPVRIRLGAVARTMTGAITTLDFVDGRDGRLVVHHEIVGDDAAARTESAVAAVAHDVEQDQAAMWRQAEAQGAPGPSEEEVFDRLERVIRAALERVR